MRSSNPQHIVTMFRYTEREQSLFPHINVYTKRIDQWLEKHPFTEQQLLRYMLAGLFLMYQASVHQGVEFTTDFAQDISATEECTVAYQRAQLFNAYYGGPITRTAQYLSLLGIADEETCYALASRSLPHAEVKALGKRLNNFYTGGLFDFVIGGQSA